MKELNDIKNSVLAEFLGVTRPFVSHVKHGRNKFSVDQAQRISKEYGIPLCNIRPDVYPVHIFKNEVMTEA